MTPEDKATHALSAKELMDISNKSASWLGNKESEVKELRELLNRIIFHHNRCTYDETTRDSVHALSCLEDAIYEAEQLLNK